MLLELLKIRRTYRSVNRARHIVNVFIKHGFGQVVEQLNLQRLLPFRKRIRILASPSLAEKNIAEHLRRAFEELGPSFIKLAQILSSRPDLITKPISDEFRKLQDEVPPFPFERVVEIMRKELKREPEDVFMSLSQTPVAAASIAQVHEATLKDGRSVIVKIQRPNIKEIIETDISIMSFIAGLMDKYLPETAFFNPKGIVEEFSRTIRRELDFMEEAKNITRFGRNFADYPGVFIPRTYPDLVTEKILVMDKVEGVRIDDIEGITGLGLDRSELARKGIDVYFKMIFDDGFFHADPHPGNIFAMPDGAIGLVDFGIVGWLPEEIIESFAGALIALVNKDFDALIDQYIELGLFAEDFDRELFARELKADLIHYSLPLYDKALTEINIAQFLDTVTHLAMKHRIKLPPDLLLINKTMLILDSIGRLLDPKFNFIVAAQPYALRLVRRKYSPERMLGRAKKHTTEIADFVMTTPKQIRQILRKVLKEDLQINMNLRGLEVLRRDMDRAANRLVFGIVVAAIIIGSALIVQSDLKGLIFDIPFLAIAGGLVGLVMGVYLLISIIRSGRL